MISQSGLEMILDDLMKNNTLETLDVIKWKKSKIIINEINIFKVKNKN